MRKTPTIMLAIASFLTVSATAMAATTTHRSHQMDSRAAAAQYDARAQGPELRYDPSTYAFEPTFDAGQTLFDRAKGGID